jgi:hypothetical protein
VILAKEVPRNAVAISVCSNSNRKLANFQIEILGQKSDGDFFGKNSPKHSFLREKSLRRNSKKLTRNLDQGKLIEGLNIR